MYKEMICICMFFIAEDNFLRTSAFIGRINVVMPVCDTDDLYNDNENSH